MICDHSIDQECPDRCQRTLESTLSMMTSALELSLRDTESYIPQHSHSPPKLQVGLKNKIPRCIFKRLQGGLRWDKECPLKNSSAQNLRTFMPPIFLGFSLMYESPMGRTSCRLALRACRASENLPSRILFFGGPLPKP